MGCRWMHAKLRWAHQQDRGYYSRVVSDLDFMTADRVTWDAWNVQRAAEIATASLIAPSCYADDHLWMTTCFLLYMNNVEVYSPERVQRQFGNRQLIPVPPPRDAGQAHG